MDNSVDIILCDSIKNIFSSSSENIFSADHNVSIIYLSFENFHEHN